MRIKPLSVVLNEFNNITTCGDRFDISEPIAVLLSEGKPVPPYLSSYLKINENEWSPGTFRHYIQNTCLPIVSIMGRERIHLLVAVTGL